MDVIVVLLVTSRCFKMSFFLPRGGGIKEHSK